MCKATPIRSARIVHHYYTAEATQATLLSSAAISLRTKVNVADQELLNNIKNEHRKESDLDDKIEIALVQRLLDLGTSKRLDKKSTPSKTDHGEGFLSEMAPTAAKCEKALQLTRSRLGKWDAELALAIIEAVGIDDAEVQVEETTRDLRLVRRHAIGLRENLSRCLEAVAILKSAILYGHHDNMDSPPLVRTF